jgi:hypothetical protein
MRKELEQEEERLTRAIAEAKAAAVRSALRFADPFNPMTHSGAGMLMRRRQNRRSWRLSWRAFGLRARPRVW